MIRLPTGMYFPGSSLIHRLDARIKLVCLIALIVATAKQREVLEAIVAGYTLRAVAERLGITQSAIRNRLFKV